MKQIVLMMVKHMSMEDIVSKLKQFAKEYDETKKGTKDILYMMCMVFLIKSSTNAEDLEKLVEEWNRAERLADLFNHNEN